MFLKFFFFVPVSIIVVVVILDATVVDSKCLFLEVLVSGVADAVAVAAVDDDAVVSIATFVGFTDNDFPV